MIRSPILAIFIAMIVSSAQKQATAESGQSGGVQSVFKLMTTESGVSFGVWGNPPFSIAPTLVILGSTIDGTLRDEYARQCGNYLADDGYLCVSIDLPCHGLQHRAGEPSELEGWSHRAANAENFVAENNERLTTVLDHLIERGFTDPNRIAACGTSRGGFLALHFAIRDPRVRCTAAFAPVTDLMKLREFEGLQDNSLVKSLNLATHADGLAGHPVWIVIGDQDERVGTNSAIACARNITTASLKKGVPSRVELHVLPEPGGHTTPRGASAQAANWIRSQMN